MIGVRNVVKLAMESKNRKLGMCIGHNVLGYFASVGIN